MAGDAVQRDDGDEAVPERRRRGEPLGAVAAVRAAVRGEEDERVLGPGASGHRAELRIPARELEQGGRSRGIRIRSRPLAGVVTMGDEDDRVGGVARHSGDDVAQPYAPEAGNGLLPGVLARFEVVERELVRVPARRALGERRPRYPARMVPGELGRRRHRRGRVERGRQQRGRERPRVRDGERGEQERGHDEEQRRPHEPAVDRPLDRPPPGAPARRDPSQRLSGDGAPPDREQVRVLLRRPLEHSRQGRVAKRSPCRGLV